MGARIMLCTKRDKCLSFCFFRGNCWRFGFLAADEFGGVVFYENIKYSQKQSCRGA
jgi:hypothetical protein